MVVDNWKGIETVKKGSWYILTWLQAEDEDDPEWYQVTTKVRGKEQAQALTHQLLNRAI